MATEQFNQLMANIQADSDAKAAEKRSKEMVNTELRSALRPVMEKLEAIEERLIDLQNTLVTKNQ